MGRSAYPVLIFVGAMAMATTACAEKASPTVLITGWYSEHEAARSFQPCGSNETWAIREPGDLPTRAQAFDLQPDTPVYVKLKAQISTDPVTQAHAMDVLDVVQFGSPTPVRDCALNGVVTHGTPGSSSSR